MAEQMRGEPYLDEALGKEKLAVLKAAAANGIYLKLRLVKCPKLWAQLLHLNVVSEEKKEEIELNGNHSNSDQVALLMEHIRRGTYRRYHNFCTALIQNDQEHIVSEFFKEEISNIKSVTMS